MRILIVNPSFLEYRVALYKSLSDLKSIDLFVLYCPNRVPDKINSMLETELGPRAIKINEKIVIDTTSGDIANLGYKVAYPIALIKTIKSLQPDTILLEGFGQWTPYVCFRTKAIPKYIFYERTLHTERNVQVIRRLYRRFISYFVSGFLVNGSQTEDYLKTFTNKPLLKNTMAVDFGIRPSSYTKANFNNSVKGLKFLFIGQLISRKGIIQLCEAWILHNQTYPNDILRIVGSGPLKDSVIEYTQSASNIELLGRIDYNDLHTVYSNSDVFVMPTLEDNWSLVVPEAMVMGLPIATTPYNGCFTELVKENGFVFDVNQIEEIVETLGKFHSADLLLMSRASESIILNYRPEIVAKNIGKYLDVHRQ